MLIDFFSHAGISKRTRIEKEVAKDIDESVWSTIREKNSKSSSTSSK